MSTTIELLDGLEDSVTELRKTLDAMEAALAFVLPVAGAVPDDGGTPDVSGLSDISKRVRLVTYSVDSLTAEVIGLKGRIVEAVGE